MRVPSSLMPSTWKNKNKFDRFKTIINREDVSLLTLTKETYILCVSKIFAAIRLVDAYGTKKLLSEQHVSMTAGKLKAG
jgi:hypothetical protein